MSFIAGARPSARTVEELLAAGVASSGRRRIVTPEGLQRRVQDTVDERIDSGTELGVQVAVIHGGRLVVNVASGLADVSGRVVQPDTLLWAASTAKGVASTVAHVLAELGVLDYDMPLAAVWPEFAQHGKDTVTVRHVLCHTAGVPGLPADFDAGRALRLGADAHPPGRGAAVVGTRHSLRLPRSYLWLSAGRNAAPADRAQHLDAAP